MRFVSACVCVVLLSSVSFAQEPAQPPTVAQLEERLTNAIKSGVAKDDEINKLKAALAQTTENIANAVAVRVKNLNTLKTSPAVVACKTAKGKALITPDAKGQLVYSGCIL